jgi:hypothetical protein
MIPWFKGEPQTIEPGMLLHYQSGLVELVGSQRYVVTGPIKAWYPALKTYWLEWVTDLANRRELGDE